MQIVISDSNQIALLAAIAKWKENQDETETHPAGVFIESITMFPYYNGNVSAVVCYRDNFADYNGKITIIQSAPEYGSNSSERSVFSAMQGGVES